VDSKHWDSVSYLSGNGLYTLMEQAWLFVFFIVHRRDRYYKDSNGKSLCSSKVRTDMNVIRRRALVLRLLSRAPESMYHPLEVLSLSGVGQRGRSP